MADINLTAAVRSNLSSLQNTASLMSKTSDRLSSGNKVNSALDNPTNFFTASSLNSRAGDLNNLMDSMANGIKTIEAADNGLTAITKNLESMQSTLRQARQDKSFESKSLELGKVDANSTTLGKLNFSGGSVANTVGIDLIKTDKGDSNVMQAGYVAPVAAQKASYAGGSGVVAVTDTLAQGAIVLSVKFPDSAATALDLGMAADTATPAARTTTQVAAAMQLKIDQSAEYAVKIKVTESAAGKFVLESVGTIDGAFTVTGTSHDTFFGDAASATPANQPAKATGSDGKHELVINGKKITLESGSTVPTAGNNLENAIKSINSQLGTDAKFQAYDAFGGKIGLRALTSDAGSLTIEGANKALFATSATNGDLKFARSVDELVAAIGADGSGLSGKIRASNDNGKLRIENLSTSKLAVEGLTDSKISGGTAKLDIAGNLVRSDLAKQFNELRDQLDKLSDDASFNGINLLRGDNLKITFNENGTSSIDIQAKEGKSINSSNLKLETTLKPADLDSDTSIDTFIDQLKGALGQVRSQSSAFGSNLSVVQNRQDFTKSMINTLETGAGNLTLADMNQEAANMMALQTRQSLASSTLSMANQADQGVLQLLRYSAL